MGSRVPPVCRDLLHVEKRTISEAHRIPIRTRFMDNSSGYAGKEK
jgi:hypothetical protein